MLFTWLIWFCLHRSFFSLVSALYFILTVVTFPLDLFQNIPEELTPVATDKYLGGTDDPVKKKDLFLDLMGDVVFGVPSVTVARQHRGESQTLDRRGTRPCQLP